MPPRDWYLVLGVSRDASQAGLRSAFRSLARRHHPDRAGPEGAARFREILEAYRVLSDPDRRREHDAALRAHASASQEPREAWRPWKSGPAPWPVPHPPPPDEAPRPLDLFERPDAIRPSADALLDRILRSVLGRPAPKAERPEPLLCEITLAPEEALRGVVVPIRIPVAARCARCRGAGHVAGFFCRACEGRGQAVSEAVMPLAIPPGVRSGSVVETSLHDVGIRNLWLRARIGVEG